MLILLFQVFKQTTSSTGIMFIDGGEKSEDYFRLDAQSIRNAIKNRGCNC